MSSGRYSDIPPPDDRPTVPELSASATDFAPRDAGQASEAAALASKSVGRARRKAAIDMLASLDRMQQRQHRRTRNLWILSLGSVVVLVAVGTLLGTIYWNDILTATADRVAVFSLALSVFLAIVGLILSWRSNVKINQAIFETAMSVFQHEMKDVWKELDLTQQELRIARNKAVPGMASSEENKETVRKYQTVNDFVDDYERGDDDD